MGSNMKKIEFTYGRKVVPIPNNETVQSASFGVAEDDFYFDATKYAKVLVKGPVRQILSPVLSKLKSISRLDRCEYATEATDILRCTQSGTTLFMKTVTAGVHHQRSGQRSLPRVVSVTLVSATITCLLLVNNVDVVSVSKFRS